MQATFRDAYDDRLSLPAERVSVLDSSGTNVLIDRDRAYLPSVGRGDRDLDPLAQGFVLGDQPTPVVQPTAGPTLFSIEEIGCTLGISAPLSRPSGEYINRQTISVLPATPAGTYTVRIGPGAYCNNLPNETHEVVLIVTS